eukprot:TRINITY_DN93651_c0_g1_i1.p1 TRINITY_DN93651_c0_g1~~TRINITY_DN93651_c0_g1_i1.p1  ORF type:complete len:506 (-),score=48.90 TRINITY_DN93651_c0_g1_i1:223-1740(-)
MEQEQRQGVFTSKIVRKDNGIVIAFLSPDDNGDNSWPRNFNIIWPSSLWPNGEEPPNEQRFHAVVKPTDTTDRFGNQRWAVEQILTETVEPDEEDSPLTAPPRQDPQASAGQPLTAPPRQDSQASVAPAPPRQESQASVAQPLSEQSGLSLVDFMYELCRRADVGREDAEGLVVKADGIFADNGYRTLGQLKKHKDDRVKFFDFCQRMQVPELLVEVMLSSGVFGPNLPARALQMDRQDRLASELMAWFGGEYDTQNRHLSRGFEADQVPLAFLIHDTSRQNMESIRSEGLLHAHPADDTRYDGRLAMSSSPSVVFFQASEYGGDPSVYPRYVENLGDRTGKRRIAMNPQHIGLHTDAYVMYFVSIAESRRDAATDKRGLLQIHVLFIPRWHVALPVCDDHFLKCNKVTFQPFRYDPRAKVWCGYGPVRNEKAFNRRPVKVNVSVAQDLPFWYDEEQSPRSVHNRGAGVFIPPGWQDGKPKAMCQFYMKNGECRNQQCTFDHAVL